MIVIILGAGDSREFFFFLVSNCSWVRCLTGTSSSLMKNEDNVYVT